MLKDAPCFAQILVTPTSPLGKQLAELSGKGSPLPCSGDSQVVGNISGWLCALWPPLPSLSFPPLYFFQKMEDQSFVFSATLRLIPLPVYPLGSAPRAGGCLPLPHGLSEPAGMWAALQSMCRSCHSAWESRGQGGVLGYPGAPRMPPPLETWDTFNMCSHTLVWGPRCFSMVWNNESCCSCESLKFPPYTLAKWSHLCFPVLPSTVPTHAAEVLFWSHTFI